MVQADEELVEMSNGCICCTMRGDLLREVTRLARAGAFDYLLIESTGVSEPMQVRLRPSESCMQQPWYVPLHVGSCMSRWFFAAGIDAAVP